VVHREWVETTFGPQLDAVPVADREAVVDLLAAATDVYVWKLLRRDRELSRLVTEQRMRVLAQAIVNQYEPRSGTDLYQYEPTKEMT
jgi:hypothetical protein